MVFSDVIGYIDQVVRCLLMIDISVSAVLWVLTLGSLLFLRCDWICFVAVRAFVRKVQVRNSRFHINTKTGDFVRESTEIIKMLLLAGFLALITRHFPIAGYALVAVLVRMLVDAILDTFIKLA